MRQLHQPARYDALSLLLSSITGARRAGANRDGGAGRRNSAADFYPNVSYESYPTYAGCGQQATYLFPSTWPGSVNFNYETNAQLIQKNLGLQTWFQQQQTNVNGMPATNPLFLPESQAYDFMNWYYYMVGLVDVQIGNVLQSVFGNGYLSITGNPTSNTAVIFLTDHGDHGCSHGLYAKGGAVYDEAIRVPLYVMVPGQTSGTVLSYMCSLVDVFRLVVELAMGAVVNWSSHSYQQYADQANRQSLFNAIYVGGSVETRTVLIGTATIPYILTTTDEFWHEESPNGRPSSQNGPACSLQSHIICLRTKSNSDNPNNLSSFYTGAKFAIYSKWALGHGPQMDTTVAQQFEFYDYTASGLHNRSELGNNYSATSPSTLQTQMAAALGSGPIYGGAAQTGLVLTELMAALQGTGYPAARAAGITAYNNWFTTNTPCTS